MVMYVVTMKKPAAHNVAMPLYMTDLPGFEFRTLHAAASSGFASQKPSIYKMKDNLAGEGKSTISPTQSPSIPRCQW